MIVGEIGLQDTMRNAKPLVDMWIEGSGSKVIIDIINQAIG